MMKAIRQTISAFSTEQEPETIPGANKAAENIDRVTGQLRADEMFYLIAITLIAILIRSIHISQPYVDAWSYKQGTIAMIAENFYHHGFNILYPQINWAGRAPGYIGTEFPLVPFIASLLYIPFGVQEWVGRSVSLVQIGRAHV